MSEFKRTALHDFVHIREKSPPLIFVGRNDVIADILTIAKKTKTNRVGIPGNTTVIQGAPGAPCPLSFLLNKSLFLHTQVTLTNPLLQRLSPMLNRKYPFHTT
ncbi:MAG: hypothetical protein OXC62_09155 [Aestuariivita sp.]|nr:hypothetical protein [Aestuariivita sp.]